MQHEAVFEALRSYICVVCEELYTRYEDVLTYRGQDYAAMLSSTNAAVAMIESAEPIMRQVANLL